MVSQCRGNIWNMCETTRILSILNEHGFLGRKKIFIFLNGFQDMHASLREALFSRTKKKI